MKSLTHLFSTTFIVAFIHSLCCLLPVIALVFGIVGLPIYLGFLTTLQPYLFGLQFILLAYGFYEIYYSAKHQACPTPRKQREKAALWFTAILTLLIAFYPYYKHAQAEKKPQFGMKVLKNIKTVQ